MKVLNSKKQSEGAKSIFTSSVGGLATIIAVAITFVGAPPLYSSTIEWVRGYSIQHYGYGLEEPTALAWAIICGLFVFFLSRATVSTALVMGGLALASRMF